MSESRIGSDGTGGASQGSYGVLAMGEAVQGCARLMLWSSSASWHLSHAKREAMAGVVSISVLDTDSVSSRAEVSRSKLLERLRVAGGDRQADAEVAIILPLATRRCRGRRVWR